MKGVKVALLQQFTFERRKETLGHGVIITVPNRPRCPACLVNLHDLLPPARGAPAAGAALIFGKALNNAAKIRVG